MSSSSWTTTSRSGLDREEPHERLDRTAGLVHVAVRHGDDRRRAGHPTRARADADLRRDGAGLVRAQRAAASARPARRRPSHPTLWRLPAYVGPGLPSPMTSHVSLTTEQYAVRAHARQRHPGPHAAGPVRHRTGPAGWSSGAGAQASSDFSAARPRQPRPRRPRPRRPPRRRRPDSSCSMPASASASASSASRASCGDLLGDVDDERLGVGDERGARGQLDGTGEDLGAGLEALDRDGDRLGDVGGLGLDLQARVVEGDDGLGSGLALEVDGDVDGDLLALADDDEVDVLDDRLDRVALDVLGQGHLLVAVDDDREEGVGVLERHHGVVARQRDVHRLGAVAVHDGGDLVVAADLAGRALAELGAGLGLQRDGVVGHGSLLEIGASRSGVTVGGIDGGGGLDAGHGTDRRAGPRRATVREPCFADHRVDHGRAARASLAGAASLAEATPRV